MVIFHSDVSLPEGKWVFFHDHVKFLEAIKTIEQCLQGPLLVMFYTNIIINELGIMYCNQSV